MIFQKYKGLLLVLFLGLFISLVDGYVLSGQFKGVEEYKHFKMIKLKKNIVIKSFSQKNPIKKINPILKNISCFNEYLKMDYIMIEIDIPFIKDKNVYIVSKKDKKILKRGYTNDMDMPCTI